MTPTMAKPLSIDAEQCMTEQQLCFNHTWHCHAAGLSKNKQQEKRLWTHDSLTKKLAQHENKNILERLPTLIITRCAQLGFVFRLCFGIMCQRKPKQNNCEHSSKNEEHSCRLLPLCWAEMKKKVTEKTAIVWMVNADMETFVKQKAKNHTKLKSWRYMQETDCQAKLTERGRPRRCIFGKCVDLKATSLLAFARKPCLAKLKRCWGSYLQALCW